MLVGLGGVFCGIARKTVLERVQDAVCIESLKRKRQRPQFPIAILERGISAG